MSLRSVGNQLLQTVPSPLLVGASSASLSLWVCVNPACDVTSPNGVEIFGDSAGKLSVTLFGSGNLQIKWSFNDGKSNGTSSCSLTLTPGTSYHLAAIWRDGSQQYYLNGNKIKSDNMTGLLGVLGDVASHPYRLGSDSAGTDVTLDEPTLWVGYGLSDQDVMSLCNRAVPPQGIVPASIALQWSLAGTDGATVQIGDAGLADRSATKLNLTSIAGTAPTYLAGVLSYTPPALIGTAAVAASGKSISLIFESNNAVTNVSAVKSADEVQTISLTTNPPGSAFTLTFGGQTTGPIPVIPLYPPAYGLWTVSTTAGASYNLYAFWRQPFGNNTEAALYEVSTDSGFSNVIGSMTFNQKFQSTGFTFGINLHGYPDDFTPMGTFTATGPNLYVRLSAPLVDTETYFACGGLLAINTSDSTSQLLNVANPAQFHIEPANEPINTSNDWPNDNFTGSKALGAGTLHSADPAVVQSSLMALSSIGPGGVSVTGSNYNTSLAIEFTGIMQGLAQSPITASDPSVNIARTSVGGVAPKIQINGGPPITLSKWLSTPSTPYAMYPLVQSSPDTQVLPAYCGLAYFTGSWNSYQGGYRGDVGYFLYSTTPGDVAYYPFEGLPPATYQLAMTWGALASLSKTVNVLIQDWGGNTLSTVVIDQTIAPADFEANGFGWKVLGTFSSAASSRVTVAITTAGSTDPVIADAVMLTRTSADVSVVVRPTDVVTLSIPDGFFTTDAGPVPAMTNLALANNCGATTNTIVPFSDVPKTMKVGYNVEVENYTAPIMLYANLAHRLGIGLGDANDANGYPTVIPGSQVGVQAVSFSYATNGEYTPGSGTMPTLPNGQYTLMWDGACDVRFHQEDSNIVSETITKSKDNIRVYNLQNPPTAYSPAIYLEIHGTEVNPADPSGTTYLCDLQDLRIFPPGIDIHNPPKFHPNTLQMLEGAQCIRGMDWLATNSGAVGDYEDLKPSSYLGFSGGVRHINATITSVVNYEGSDVFFDKQYFLVAEITTSVPHTFRDGMQATTTNSISFVTSDGENPTTTLYGYVRVLSPTVILMGFDRPSNFAASTRSIISASFPAGTALTEAEYVGTPNPFPDLIELCNTVGCDLWLNIPVGATDDCVTQMGAYVAANLAPGRKVHVEFANEAWNFGFQTFQYCCSVYGAVTGTSYYNNYVPGFVYRTGTTHQLFAAQMAAAGRPGDMIRTYGTFGGEPSNTAAICAEATRQGFVVDEVAVAPYFDNGFSPPQTWGPITELMIADQDLDLLELNIEYDGLIDLSINQHYAQLAASAFPNAKVWCYEGGPDSFIAPDTSGNYNVRNHTAIRHTRAYSVMLRYLQRLQDAGCEGINIFYLGAPTIGFHSDNQINQFLWSTYTAWNQQPGTGDPNVDTVNDTNPNALDQIKSEIGGAIKRWNSLVPSTVPISPKPPIRARNGQIKTTGFSRGHFHPVR